MVSELVVLASCVMLSAAQLQIPQHFMQSHQIALLPNIQPVQLSSFPNSQAFMTQTANTIISQDLSTPLNPGFVGSMPVIVSEATQNAPQLFAAPQVLIPISQASRSPPVVIPITSADAVQTSSSNFGAISHKPLGTPQSLRFPVLSSASSHQRSSFVPIRSLKSLVGPVKPKFSPSNHLQRPSNNGFRPIFFSANSAASKAKPYQDIPANHPVPTKPLKFTNEKIYYDIPSNHPVPKPTFTYTNHKIYYDIPPNHPVPKPPKEKVYYDIPLNHPLPPRYVKDTNKPSAVSDALLSEQQLDFGKGSTRIYPVSKQNYDDIDYMRPPLPPAQLQHQAPSFRDQVYTISGDSIGRKHHRSTKPEENQPLQKNQGELQSESVPLQATLPLKKPTDTPRFLDQLKETLKRVQFSNTDNVGPKYEVNQNTDENSPPSKSEDGNKRKNADSSTDFSDNYYQQVPPVQGYNTFGGYNNGGYSSGGYDNQQPIIHKHIYVHSAPQQYSQASRVRVIRPPIIPEKHVNLIFVKSPQDEAPPQTIVELPQAEQPKTVVYVLSKKQPKESGEVRFIKPPQGRPHPPEIYFIRYGDSRGGYGYGNRGIPVPNLQSLYESGHQGAPATLPQPQKGDRDIQAIMPPPPPLRSLYTPNFRTKRDRDYVLENYAPLMAYATTGQVNEITAEEAEARKTSLDAFF